MEASATPRLVLLAGAGVALETVAAAVATVLLVVGSGDLPVATVIGQAVLFLIGAAGLGFVGVGLLTGRRWARTPAIVIQLLLLPVVYSLIGPSREIVLGVVAGLVVAGTFLLLISETARTWSMDLPPE